MDVGSILTYVTSLANLHVVLIFLSVFLLSFYILKRPSNLPPGPRIWPIIGSSLFFRDAHKRRRRFPLAVFDAWDKYGDIVYFQVGRQGMVIFNGYNAINEGFVKNADVLSDRPSFLKNVQDATKEGKGNSSVVVFLLLDAIAMSYI